LLYIFLLILVCALCLLIYRRSSTVGYSTDDVILKWIDPRHKAVQFDKTGEELPQFVIKDFDLDDCSFNDTTGHCPAIQYNLF